MPPPGKGFAEKLGSKTTSNVSPGQSMAMTGNTSLAGLSQEAASDAVKAGKQNPKGTKYGGKLADFMAKKNVEIAQNQAKVQRDLLADPSKAGFKGFLPKGLGQGLQKFGQGIMQNMTPARMIASGIGSLLFGPIGGVLAGLLANRATTDAFKKDVGDTIDFGQKLGSNLQTDFLDTVNFFRPNFNVDTPDADIVRAGDFNFIDRITNAIAAPNISTGVGELFKPRAMGLPEDFLDQSAVETQQLNPVMGMQYDDFVNPQYLQTIGMNQFDLDEQKRQNLMEGNTPSKEATLNSMMPMLNINPNLDPRITTFNTPVVNPNMMYTEQLGKEGKLPQQQQELFDQNLLGFNKVFDI